MNNDTTVTTDEKNLVIARLSTLPSNMGLAIGDEGTFTVEELKKAVEDGDELGNKYVEMQLEFLRSIKDGSLFE